MNVRNFFVRTEVDGRKTVDASGPKSKDGGFETLVYIRDAGEAKLALRVQGFAAEDGTLRLQIIDETSSRALPGGVLWDYETHRLP